MVYFNGFSFFTQEIRHITDGDVIIFEKKYRDETLELPTCDDYFRDLLYRIEVTFVDKTNPNDVGFSLELSQRMTYDQMASAVGQKINVNPYEIQFFKCQKWVEMEVESVSGCQFIIFEIHFTVTKMYQAMHCVARTTVVLRIC